MTSTVEVGGVSQMTQNLKIHYPLKYDYKGVFSLPKSNMGGMCYGRVDGTPTLS